MITHIFVPPLPKPTGGLAVLFQIAEHLHGAGFEVRLVPRETPAKTLALPEVPIVPWEKLSLTPDDLWLAPEGWANALTPGLKAKARSVVYCQNWAYLFSSLPENVHWQQLDVSFLGVSHPVSWYIQQTTGKRAPVLRPGIDLAAFRAPKAKPPLGKDQPLYIAYMPRKNKALARQIHDTLGSRRKLYGAKSKITWLEISGQDQEGVAGLLAKAHIFLATGFPEGCPLPPLEAMASGCLVTGYAGFGGWDYMRQAMPGGYTPWWPQRPEEETPWQGNGLYAADADIMAAVMALEQAIHWWETKAPELQETLSNARKTVARYSLDTQRDRVLELWARIRDEELF